MNHSHTPALRILLIEDDQAVVDLLDQRALLWTGVAGEPFEIAPIPEALAGAAAVWRGRLIEAVVEQDDSLLAAWLNGVEPSVDQLRAGIRRGTLAGAFVPVLAGSAFKNRGIESLLDAINDYLPTPGEAVGDDAQPESDPDGPLAALAFKVVDDAHGAMTFVRVYRGRLRPGDTVLNTNTGRTERVSRLYEVHADKHEERASLQAGDIAAIVGLKDTLTGHTLTANTPAARAHPLVLEQISIPEPVIDIAVEPKTQADSQQLGKALHALVKEDPSLRVSVDAESGQTILSGMGELQLEVTLEKLRTRHRVEVRAGRPKVAYRETISQPARVTHLHKKQSGGPGQFAEVTLELRPLARGEGFAFRSEIVGGAIPREYIPAVEAGVRRAALAGVAAGFAVVDFEAVLLDGRFHERDSSTLAFELAAVAAFREAAARAAPQVLEPVMNVEVITPAEYLGDEIGDLHRRRGAIRSQEPRGTASVVHAHVPLKEMFGYIGNLRALSSGRAQYSMQFDHYAVATAHVAAEAMAA